MSALNLPAPPNIWDKIHYGPTFGAGEKGASCVLNPRLDNTVMTNQWDGDFKNAASTCPAITDWRILKALAVSESSLNPLGDNVKYGVGMMGINPYAHPMPGDSPIFKSDSPVVKENKAARARAYWLENTTANIFEGAKILCRALASANGNLGLAIQMYKGFGNELNSSQALIDVTYFNTDYNQVKLENA